VPAGGRLDGHVVQGHVDGVATLVSRNPGPRWDELTFDVPVHLRTYIAPQGSIALSGVSLTVTHVTDAGFGVALIPTTLALTTLGLLQPGDEVNVEVDVLAKYVERILTTSKLTAGEAS
jgi:riboflavin synthase